MFKNIFVQLLQTRNITAYKVAKETGIAQGLMNQYKNGKKTPTTENLIKIADYLKCSIDYLLGRKGESEEEIRLILDYRELSEEGKRALLNYAEMAAESNQYKKYTNLPEEA